MKKKSNMAALKNKMAAIFSYFLRKIIYFDICNISNNDMNDMKDVHNSY